MSELPINREDSSRGVELWVIAGSQQFSSEGINLSEGIAVRKTRLTVPEILNQLEAHYGKQEPCWPSDPYLFLLWWYCGYPASDASCSKGWKELTDRIGTDPDAILAAHPAKLTAALRPGGILPELRAERMKEVTARIKNEFDGDLRASLAGSITKIRKVLKSFPSIADAGADRILLFARIKPVAAVPSNCTGVVERHSERTRGKELQRKLRRGPAHDCLRGPSHI